MNRNDGITKLYNRGQRIGPNTRVVSERQINNVFECLGDRFDVKRGIDTLEWGTSPSPDGRFYIQKRGW